MACLGVWLLDCQFYLCLMRVCFTAWIFELSGGAIADFEDTCLPKEQREAKWTIAALHQWDMGIDDPRCVTTAEDVGVSTFSSENAA